MQLHLSYTIDFGSFLSVLKDETALQNDNGGFTLKDGPWKYSAVLESKIDGLWFELDAEKSYVDMLARLKAGQGEAVMIHVSTFL